MSLHLSADFAYREDWNQVVAGGQPQSKVSRKKPTDCIIMSDKTTKLCGMQHVSVSQVSLNFYRLSSGPQTHLNAHGTKQAPASSFNASASFFSAWRCHRELEKEKPETPCKVNEECPKESDGRPEDVLGPRRPPAAHSLTSRAQVSGPRLIRVGVNRAPRE